MTTERSHRKERGEAGRARLRALVAGSGPSPAPGLPGDGGDLAEAAAWWTEQGRFGARVVDAAHQILAAVGSLRSSPNRAALEFELGGLAYGFSEILVREVSAAVHEPLSDPTSPGGETDGVCRVCGATAPARTWRDGRLEFLRTSCAGCTATATVSRARSAAEDDWPRFVVEGGRVAVVRAPADGPASATRPHPPSHGSSAPHRLVLLLELAPNEIIWSR